MSSRVTGSAPARVSPPSRSAASSFSAASAWRPSTRATPHTGQRVAQSAYHSSHTGHCLPRRLMFTGTPSSFDRAPSAAVPLDEVLDARQLVHHRVRLAPAVALTLVPVVLDRTAASPQPINQNVGLLD